MDHRRELLAILYAYKKQYASTVDVDYFLAQLVNALHEEINNED